MPCVLLTRPQKDSAQLAAKLARHGYTSLIEPLLVVRPNGNPSPNFKTCQAVMLTSAHALDSLAHKSILNLPCFCVGTRTADAAREFGFSDVRNAAGDGLALANQIVGALDPAAGGILYIAGDETDSRAANEVVRQGFQVMSWTTYAADKVEKLSPAVIKALHNGSIDAVLLFSRRTAETFKALLIQEGLETCCKRMIALGISSKVCAALVGLPWRRLKAAASPSEDSLLLRLFELLPPDRGIMTDPLVPVEPSPKKTGVKIRNICALLVALVCAVAIFYCVFCPESAPPRPVIASVSGGNAAMQAEIDSLTQRVKVLESREENPGTTTASPGALSPDTASPGTPSSTAPMATPIPTPIQNDAATAAAISHVQNDVVSLSSALSALQDQVKATGATTAQMRDSTEAMIASVVAFIQLRDAETTGHKFDAELGTLRDASKDDPVLQTSVARLQPYAAAGVPTVVSLQQDLLMREPAVAIVIAKGNAQNWWERLMAQLRGLVTVRPIHGGEGDTLAGIESALINDGPAAALDLFKQLPADAQNELAEWKSHLEARQYVDSEITTIAAHYTSPTPAVKTP